MPFVLLSATAIWIEHGWLVAALCLVGGLALGLFVRWRHRNDWIRAEDDRLRERSGMASDLALPTRTIRVRGGCRVLRRPLVSVTRGYARQNCPRSRESRAPFPKIRRRSGRR